jgi:hemerythrin
MIIRWHTALAVGHPGIDEQHREMFRRAQALVDALTRRDRAEVARHFEFLGGYAIEHFGDEERLMLETGYPGHGVHRAEHQRFIRDYRALSGLFERHGIVPALTVRASTWLADWLERHIGGADQRLAGHLASSLQQRSA